MTLQGRESVLLVLHDLTQMRRVETTRREFVANVSHELRTPLASIRASAETLQDGAMEDPEAARQFLGRIIHNAERMSALVQDLLDLSRLESGEVKLSLSPVDVGRVIQEVVEIHGEQARAKGVSLAALWTRTRPVEATADESRLQQVLSNLVENAVKFTPSGGEVHVEAERRGRWLEVRVLDSGMSGLRLRTRPTCSSGSTRRTGCRTRAGRGWGWRLPSTSSSPTGAGCGSAAGTKGGVFLGSGCLGRSSGTRG